MAKGNFPRTDKDRQAQRRADIEMMADRLVALVLAALEDDDHKAPPGVKEWLREALLRNSRQCRKSPIGRA
jgi:hypothetical protein